MAFTPMFLLGRSDNEASSDFVDIFETHVRTSSFTS